MSSLLVVNADDFGLTEGVNEGIVEACERGVLRAATLMANGPAFEHAVERARRCPRLDVGCHLILIGGRALTPPHEELPRSLKGFFGRLAAGWSRERIEAEFRAQIGRLIEAGIRPSHLDTHKHTHLAPVVLEAMLQAACDHGIRWIRRPFDVPLTEARGSAPAAKRLVSRALRPLQRSFERKIAQYGCRATDHFAGFQLTGHLRTQQLASLIRALPEGLTEFMCHPGHCTPELLASKTRLKESRAAELEALTSPEVLEAVRQAGVRLVSFRDAMEAADGP